MPVELILVELMPVSVGGQGVSVVRALSNHGLVWNETVHRYHNNRGPALGSSARQRVLQQRALLVRVLRILSERQHNNTQ
jgi:hypothetical protein